MLRPLRHTLSPHRTLGWPGMAAALLACLLAAPVGATKTLPPAAAVIEPLGDRTGVRVSLFAEVPATGAAARWRWTPVAPLPAGAVAAAGGAADEATSSPVGAPRTPPRFEEETALTFRPLAEPSEGADAARAGGLPASALPPGGEEFPAWFADRWQHEATLTLAPPAPAPGLPAPAAWDLEVEFDLRFDAGARWVWRERGRLGPAGDGGPSEQRWVGANNDDAFGPLDPPPAWEAGRLAPLEAGRPARVFRVPTRVGTPAPHPAPAESAAAEPVAAAPIAPLPPR